MAATAQSTGTSGLRRNAIGLREVLFQSITDMAPGAAIAASIPAGVAFAAGSLPLAVVFALIACLFCAASIGLLAREMPSAGSDRKSTRLNSSHSQISYAVFCLKKKKQQL